jgi:MoaA/NifB/PqqE/SkfB family radical SAM enzyme
MRPFISLLQKYLGNRLSYGKLIEISNKMGIPIAPPLTASINVTLRCNSRCSYCDVWKIPNKPDDISLCQLNKILQSLNKLGTRILTLGGGEPLLRDDLEEIISLAKSYQMLVNIPTNGILLTSERANTLAEAGVNILILSLDSSDPRVYEKHRGVSFKVAERAIASLLSVASKYPDLTVAICCVITNYNISNLVSFTNWIWKRGDGKISLNFQPYHYPLHQGKQENNEFIPKPDRKAILEKQIDELINLKRLGAPINNSDFYLQNIPDFLCANNLPHGFRCLAGYAGIVITGDLKVLPCWRLPPTGDLRSENLVNIWFSRRHQKQRKYMNYLRCPRCWLTCHNERGWYEWYDSIYKSPKLPLEGKTKWSLMNHFYRQ